MKKTILIFLFLLMNGLYCAQNNIKVWYTFQDPVVPYIFDSYLQVGNDSSYFEINNKAITEDKMNTSHDSNGNTNYISLKKGEVNQFVYKNYEKDSIATLTYGFLNKHVYIKEENPKFEWNIEHESKEILKQNCKKATTTFRGRNYVAWFSPEIKISEGPWKFSGLPGLILEIHDVDNEVNIVATQLIFNPKNNTIVLPKFDTKYKIYNWKGYTKSVDTDIKNLSKQFQSIASETGATVDYKAKFNGIDYIYKN